MVPTLPGGMQGGAHHASPGADYLGQKVDFVKLCANMIASVQPSRDAASNSSARRRLATGIDHGSHFIRDVVDVLDVEHVLVEAL